MATTRWPTSMPPTSPANSPLNHSIVLLTAFAALARGQGVVADIGCGPGHVARYVHDLGLPTLRIDLAPVMMATAQRLHPDLAFQAASMLNLPVADGAWGGILAFYSIVHLLPAGVPQAFAEFYRALRPCGRLLLSFHIGNEIRHLSEWWEQPVDLDFHFFAIADVAQRGYLLAGKTGVAAAAA